MTLVFVKSEDLVHSSPQIDSPPDNSLYPHWDLFIFLEYMIELCIAKTGSPVVTLQLVLAS